MDELESLLAQHINAVERFVRFRIGSKADADDVLGEVYLAACRNFPVLRDKDAFKGWIISIARNKCNDYFRRKAACCEVPVDKLNVKETAYGRYGVSVVNTVRDTLSLLGDKDKQILYLFFWKELPQAEIARLLDIPVGTVKSRLHTAKRNFKNKYPYPPKTKGERGMKKLPEYLPDYKIEERADAPFDVKWEELMGWFLVPKLGEKLSWALYDIPSRKCDRIFDMKVIGKARVHGIEGVELTAREASYSDKNDVIDRTFIAQLTDTHCRFLAQIRSDGDVRSYLTFLDGDEFMPNWGFGENNCGNETNLHVKGAISRRGDAITCDDNDFLIDIVGRYNVTIAGRSYDTVCVMDICEYESGVLGEQFLDKNGRTVLWRRFNRDDWAIDRYKKTWSELLPENERLTVNGTTYVHWYDCIADYII